MGSAIIATPVGRLHLTESAAVLSSVSWYKTKRSIGREGWSILPPPASPLGHLRAYFDRRLKTFSLPLAPAATPFQGRVHDAILADPHNQTAAYSEAARTIGNRPRGVAQGYRTSPLPIVVPCPSGGRAQRPRWLQRGHRRGYQTASIDARSVGCFRVPHILMKKDRLP